MATDTDNAPANAPRKVPCPTCGEPADFARTNASRPFCSRRCKLIDLGAWASDQYRVAGTKDDSASRQSDNNGS